VTENPNTIKNRFSACADIECWVLSNKNKQPCTIHSGKYLTEPQKEYNVGDMLRWKEEPQDHINTLSSILKTWELLPGYGFGVLLNKNNSIACFDFDHALDDNGNIINTEVRQFVEVISSFTEVSSSGKGLHVFVYVEIPDDETIYEYAFKKSFGDGKFYPSRFIKMTGNCPEGFDLPLKVLVLHELNTIRRKMSNEIISPSFRKSTSPSQCSSTELNWGDILTEVGILHTNSQYVGKSKNYPDGTCKMVIESYRIPCPNRFEHTDFTKRTSQFGPDAAILTRWDDKTTSCTCNHNGCSPDKHPNLLQKLWDEIRELRMKDAKSILSKYTEGLS
jgi:hypothetical protein